MRARRSSEPCCQAPLGCGYGPVSIATALATAARPGWVLSGIGLASFVVWNVLIVAMTALALLAMRARRQAG